jgi:UDP-2,4-diacetamido-2,4,6-trideoxy-beta-L-altropyranose hydrolase
VRIAIRTDASAEIGTGHVVRCLALADELNESGARVSFVCRHIPDSLASLIAHHGHSIDRLPCGDDDWEGDVRGTVTILAGAGSIDWLIVDHYSLDARWESRAQDRACHVMVIDDLADRPHHCEVLLDQNDATLGGFRYRSLVPAGARLLLGPQFALVREEFRSLRASALNRRSGELRRVLVFMGGNDPSNETTKALQGLQQVARPELQVDVVIGAGNPHRHEVQTLCARLPRVRLHVQTSRMADLMMASDCSIGAGGSATWERCVLGLPSLTTVLAENQRHIATLVADAGAQRVLGPCEDLTPEHYTRAVAAIVPKDLLAMSTRAASLCDGQGAPRVAAVLTDAQALENVNA